MGWDEDDLVADIETNVEQIATVKRENGPTVRRKISDRPEAAIEPLHGLET